MHEASCLRQQTHASSITNTCFKHHVLMHVVNLSRHMHQASCLGRCTYNNHALSCQGYECALAYTYAHTYVYTSTQGLRLAAHLTPRSKSRRRHGNRHTHTNTDLLETCRIRWRLRPPFPCSHHPPTTQLLLLVRLRLSIKSLF